MELTVRGQNQHAYILTLKKLLLGEIFMKFKNILRGTSLIDYISFSD